MDTPSVVTSSDPTSSFEPAENCPEYWPESVMGFNLCGRTTSAPVEDDLKPTEINPNKI